jgi:hypothetical protein
VPLRNGELLRDWTHLDTVPSNWYMASQNASDVEAPEGLRLGDLFEVHASMTTGDAYEAVSFVEDSEAGEGQKLITTGLIDPMKCLWGETKCRYLKKDFRFPRLSVTPDMPSSLIRRLNGSQRPKVIAAGLGNRIEAFCDAEGKCIGAVSTYSIYDREDDATRLRQLSCLLCNPKTSEQFRKELGANALGGGSITVRKEWLQDLIVTTEGGI